VPAVAAKVALVAPEATVTEDGTVRAALLSVMLIAVPPLGAAFDTVTVQVLAAFELRLVGAQLSDDSVTEAVRPMEAVFETPLKVAVTVAV
jgi:hypothetical protein